MAEDRRREGLDVLHRHMVTPVHQCSCLGTEDQRLRRAQPGAPLDVLLDEVWRPTGLGGILHCFTSTLEDAQHGVDMGFLISFAGNSTYPKAANIRDVAKALPLEKILIETDSPFLAPQGFRGKRNEPAYLAEVAKAIATVRNLTAEEVAAATAANFRRFFAR